jgi:hypothetical protein
MFARYFYNRRGYGSSNNINGNISSSANAAVTATLPSVASSSPAPPTSATTTKHRRRRQNQRSYGGGASHEDASSQAAVAAAASSLEELRLALDRLEYLIAKIAPSPLVAPLFPSQGENKEGVAAEEDEVTIIPTPGNCGNNHRYSCNARDISKEKKDGDYNAETAAEADEEENAGENTSTSTTATNINNVNKNIKFSYGKNDKSSKNAIFLQVEQSDELEIVELLRRIAELVVLSERRAGKLLYEAASSAVVSDAKNNSDDSDHGDDKVGVNDYGDQLVDEEEGVGGSEGVVNDSFDGELATSTTTIEKRKTSREGSKKTKIIHRQKRLPDYNDDEASPFLAPFELFCERNALANIVDIVTGAAFARQGERPPSRQLQSQRQQLWKLEEPTRGIDGDEGRLLLPPLSIATQAVQSISILIQNVSRATSLYFLLSNNVINEFIRLPLDSYRLATIGDSFSVTNDEDQLARNANNTTTRVIPAKRGHNDANHRQQSSQPEISELITHFVSFLKSLAMRMNAETVQFFLSFPNLNNNSNNNSPLPRPPEEKGGEKNTLDFHQISPSIPRSQSTAESGYEQVVEFPLYARALEFCAISDRSDQCQDPFVRVTAMSVCMNILRLVTIHDNDDIDNIDCECRVVDDVDGHGMKVRGVDDEDERNDGARGSKAYDVQYGQRPRRGQQREERRKRHRQQQPISLPTSTPNGLLHDDPPVLPIEDRIAIAQFACHPSRVSDLISPLCMRLTSRFGQVEGIVRMLQEMDGEEKKHDSNNGDFYDTSKMTATVTTPPPANKSATLSWSPSSSKSTTTATTSSSAGGEKRRGAMQETKLQSDREQQHAAAAAETTRRRMRLSNALHDLMADVQDELLLLDDLLKVGLISLNEQTIEMILATFVYPMLLQPLLLLLLPQQCSAVQQLLLDDGVMTVSAVGKRRNKCIPPQAPSPLSISCDAVEISDNKGGSLMSIKSPDGSGGSNNSIDLAPLKTALYGLSLVFNTITNTTFRYLLLTALLHPSSPFVASSGEKCGDVVVCARPVITLPKPSNKRYTISSRKSGESPYGNEDFRLEVRTEANQARQQSMMNCDGESFQQDVANVYTFGTETPWSQRGGSYQGGGQGGRNDSNNSNSAFDGNDHFGNACFILAPALFFIFQNVFKTACGGVRNEATLYTTTTRLNPYRKILFSLISGPSELVALQPLATAALQAAVLSVDSLIIRKIMFTWMEDGRGDITSTFTPTSISPASRMSNCTQLEDECVEEIMKCLCRGIVNTLIAYDGWWKVKFNTVAARTLMAVISNDHDCIRLASAIVGDIRHEAAKFLLTLPSHLDTKSREGMEDSIINDIDYIDNTTNTMRPNNPVDRQHLDHWLLDRFFFDQAGKSMDSVVEKLSYLKEHGGNDDVSSERYRYGLEVLTTISMIGTSALLCESMPVVDNMAFDESNVNSPFHFATTWALACLYLDAFCVKLTKMCDDKKKSSSLFPEQNVGVSQRKLSYISLSGTSSRDDNSQIVDSCSSSLAHISSKFAIAMLDEGESLERRANCNSNNALPPVHGSAVGLVGKAAFPCVCEVSCASSNLFTGRTCISNEGIRWQSLYLVVVGRWAVLAEPGHSGTGGEGRVISSCRLACLAVKKDTSASVNSRTPARRLLVAHASLDPHPPPLFLADTSAASSMRHGGGGGCPNLSPNGLRLMHSRMDLWFEDETAAAHACKIISTKIAKARTRRGARIRTALLAK